MLPTYSCIRIISSKFIVNQYKVRFQGNRSPPRLERTRYQRCEETSSLQARHSWFEINQTLPEVDWAAFVQVAFPSSGKWDSPRTCGSTAVLLWFFKKQWECLTFNEEWMQKYLFTNIDNKSICLLLINISCHYTAWKLW